MAQQSLRVVDPNREHTREIARRRVKEFRTLVEQESFPICNQRTEQGGSYLATDEVLRRSEREMPEVAAQRSSLGLYLGLFLVSVCVVGLVLLVNSMR